MFKKAFFISSLFLSFLSITAWANGGVVAPAAVPVPDAHLPTTHVGHFYAGVGISGELGSFDTTLRNRFFDQTTTPQDRFDTIIHKHFNWRGLGFDGEIFAGYGWILNNKYYIGIEGFGSLSTLKANFNKHSFLNLRQSPQGARNTPINSTGKIKSNYAFGIAVLPGIKLNRHSMFYVRVGWTYRHFDINGTLNGRTVLIEQPFTQAYDISRGRSGIQAGVGIRTLFTDNWGMRFEYDYNRYENITGRIAGSNSIGDQFTSQLKIKPVVHQFKLDFFYNFY